MVVLLFVRHRKNDLYIRIESLQSVSLEVGSGFEVDTILGSLQGLGRGKQMLAAPVRIGDGFVDERPVTVLHKGKIDRNSGSGASKRGIENVC